MTDNISKNESQIVRVLLIENNKADILLVERVLSNAKRVHFVFTSVDCISKAEQYCAGKKPDIILLGIDYFDDKAVESVNQLASNIADVPLIVLIGRQERLSLAKIIQAGAQDCFLKDELNTDKLTQAVLYALGSKNIEKSLRETYNELVAMESKFILCTKLAGIGQLSSGIAHEINNPLCYIMTNLDLINTYISRISQMLSGMNEFIAEYNTSAQADIKPLLEKIAALKQETDFEVMIKDFHEAIDAALDGSRRIRKIVSALLTFSHPERTDFTYTDINKEIDKALILIWHEIRYKYDVIKNYQSLPAVFCNPRDICHVFVDILLNAYWAIDDHGEVTIKTYCDDYFVFVEISDNGKGISPYFMDKIFKPFFTPYDTGKKLGSSLFLAYGIVKNHGGTIEVSSEHGKGATFTIKLPLGQEQQT
jgi:signal transduction histidine kinase